MLSVLDERHAGCSNFLKQMWEAEITASEKVRPHPHRPQQPPVIQKALEIFMSHLLCRQNQVARSTSVMQDMRPWPGNTFPWSKDGRTAKGLPPLFTQQQPWARQQAGINTAHTAWGSTEGKGPGYLVDNSHYVEVKGLEHSLGNLDQTTPRPELLTPHQFTTSSRN